MSETLNTVNILVFMTFLYAAFLKYLKKGFNHYVLYIILISLINELVAFSCIYAVDFGLISRQEHSLCCKISDNVYVLIHHVLWLLLIRQKQMHKMITNWLIIIFIFFAIVNFVFIQQLNFNYYTFIVGAVFYLVLFFKESFMRLKKEDFDFIFSNEYLLMCAPIMFFFGMSQLFAFVSGEVTGTIIFGQQSLFNLVNRYVCLVYYLLIIIYLYRQKKQLHEYL